MNPVWVGRFEVKGPRDHKSAYAGQPFVCATYAVPVAQPQAAPTAGDADTHTLMPIKETR